MKSLCHCKRTDWHVMAEDDNTGMGRWREIEQLVWQQEAEQEPGAQHTVSRSHPHPPVPPSVPPNFVSLLWMGLGWGFRSLASDWFQFHPLCWNVGLAQLEIEGFLVLWPPWGRDYSFTSCAPPVDFSPLALCFPREEQGASQRCFTQGDGGYTWGQ